MAGRSKWLTYGLPAVGAAALIAGIVLVLMNNPSESEEDPPRQPTTAPQLSGEVDASEFIGAIGVSEPPGEASSIAAHLAGVVEAVPVEVGQQIERGSVVLRVDARQAEAAVALRESEVAVAEADVMSLRARVPPRRAAVRAAEAQVASAEAELADRRNQLRIVEAVSDPRAVSAEQKDTRRFAVQQAEARLQQAEAQLAEAVADLQRLVEPGSGDDGPELVAAEQRVEMARRDLEQARTNLELLTVNAPFDAEVLQVNVEPGEFAPASVSNEGLIVLGRQGVPHLRVEVDEVDIPRFSRTARAWASPRGNAELRLPLDLAYVEPLVVPKTNLSGNTRELIDTRVLQVVYEFAERPGLIGLGQQFDVYIETTDRVGDGAGKDTGKSAKGGG